MSSTISGQPRSPALNPEPSGVIDRSGQSVFWDPAKIKAAIRLAFTQGEPGSSGQDAAQIDWQVDRVTERVVADLASAYAGQPVPIERIQDQVEVVLIRLGYAKVAEAWQRYRDRRAQQRSADRPEVGLADYIAASRYCRYRPDLLRRETWSEAVSRVAEMHRRKFTGELTRAPSLADVAGTAAEVGLPLDQLPQSLQRMLTVGATIDLAFRRIDQKRILPSMRSLQFGGRAVEANEARIYNCSYSYADRLSFFPECFFLLLSGVGVGFSVQHHHVAQLPPLAPAEKGQEPETHVIADSIEGWSEAVRALFEAHVAGRRVRFDYRLIRPKGAPLVTSGGKAPGPDPLRRSLEDIATRLEAASGRKLRSIEVYDVTMLIARAVLSGGIRRSATLCLFSPDDDEMASAKSGDWYQEHPYRAYSNNSALLVRNETQRVTFDQFFARIRTSGEPGFYFAEDRDYGANPCVEIGLCPSATLTEADVEELQRLDPNGNYAVGQKVSGWQMCNLTTINGATVEDAEGFYEACHLASAVGTLQAAYSNIEYIGPVSRFLNERERLIGVSICGILDRPHLLLDEEILRNGARVVRVANRLMADLLGIQSASRVTCVKPEGTASLVLGAGSGIHPHHAPRYLRRVQANRSDPVYQHFRDQNPEMVEPSVYAPETDDVITFPLEAPVGARCRADYGAVDFLDLVRRVQLAWVAPGTDPESVHPDLRHNVSNTVSVGPNDWEAVADAIWEQRHDLAGVALLPMSGDKDYPQAPREEVVTAADLAKWEGLEYHPVNYAEMVEADDQTKLSDVAACAGGKCELV